MVKRREILFGVAYFLNNPNGDIDNDNMPRQLPDGRIFTTDVFLKRRIRDYVIDYYFDKEENGKKFKVFIRPFVKTEEKGKTSLSKVKKEDILEKDLGKKYNLPDDALRVYWDVRVFGATFTDSDANTITGPVQFSYGVSYYSDEIMSNSITTVVTKDDRGGIGVDNRAYKNVLFYYGVVNNKLAEISEMDEKDYEILKEALINSLKNNTTHTKIGFKPLILLEVIYNKDFRSYYGNMLVDLLNEDPKESSLELPVEKIKELINNILEKYKEHIEEINIYVDNKYKPSFDGLDNEKIKIHDL